MSYTHITTFERGNIESLYKIGYSVRGIAKEVGRHHSTIARELERNSTDREYSSMQADDRYWIRRTNCKQEGKINPELVTLIEEKLRSTWSPEQISCSVLDGILSFKTIYNWLYEGKLLSGDLSVLRQKGKSRKPSEKRGRFKVGRSIHDRSVDINERKVFGHWEADSVVSGRGKSKGSFATFVERKTRFYMAVKMPDRTAASMNEAIEKVMEAFPPGVIKSITVDRGKEFTCYPQVESSFDVQVYFADAYSSWQRGSNENGNGLLREFFPKASDLSLVKEEKLYDSLRLIMHRPRKTLGWKTSYEAFMDELLKIA